jgi:hypothetical protein
MIDTFQAFEKRQKRQQAKPRSKAMRMTFGNHIGQPLDQIPKGYLRWVVGNVTDLEPTPAEAIGKAIAGEPIPEEVVIDAHDMA